MCSFDFGGFCMFFGPVEFLAVRMKRYCWSFPGLYPSGMPYIFTSGSNILKVGLDVYGDCFRQVLEVFLYVPLGRTEARQDM